LSPGATHAGGKRRAAARREGVLSLKRFENRTVLVTGAGSGVGAACVRRLFAEGASIVAADVRREEVDKVVSEFGGSDRIYGVGVDVSNQDQVAAFVSGAVQRFGKLHGLVNSAGIRGVGNVLDLDPLAEGPVGQPRRHVQRVPSLRSCREGSANACGNRKPQLCSRDQGRAQPPRLCRVIAGAGLPSLIAASCHPGISS
jgi:hypothetical protein